MPRTKNIVKVPLQKKTKIKETLKSLTLPFVPSISQQSLYFPAQEWKERKTCWVNIFPQGGEEWLLARKGEIKSKGKIYNTRVTTSNFATATNRNRRFSTPETLAKEIAGLEIKTFSPEAMERMNHGTVTEPKAREWYEKTQKVKVREIGVAVPKWNFHLGASVDGEVIDQPGIIEIKCPKNMYGLLSAHFKKMEKGWRPKTPFYHSHIWTSHYDQMQGGMAILNKDWCDYIVYTTEDELVYNERVLFNESYWNNFLLPKLEEFLTTELFPLYDAVD